MYFLQLLDLVIVVKQHHIEHLEKKILGVNLQMISLKISHLSKKWKNYSR